MREINWTRASGPLSGWAAWTECAEWARTELGPEEDRKLRGRLTAEQGERLLRDDYVWVDGLGVLWKSEGECLRRARFTHGMHFELERGEFYVDAQGRAREFTRGGEVRRQPRAAPLSERRPGDRR